MTTASSSSGRGPGGSRTGPAADDDVPAVRLSVVTLGIPFFTHLLGLAATWAALKQLQILWICDEVLGPEVPLPGNNGSSLIPGLGTSHVNASWNALDAFNASSAGMPPHLLDRCDAPEVQATVSAWFTVLSLCYNIPSIVLVPIFGYFLDRWSRKRIIILAMSFSIIHTLSMLLITYYHVELAEAKKLLPALALSTLVHGLGGGRHVIVMSIFALVADVTTRAERTTYIARFESIILGAFTVGPLMGGIIVKLTGSNIPPLYVSMALDVFTIGWFIFVVPETMRRDSSKGVAGGEVKDYQRLPDSELPEDSVVAIVAQGNIVSDDDNSDAGASGKPSPSPVDPIAEATTPASILHSIFARENMNRTLLILILLILNLVSGGVMFFFVLYTRAHFGWKAYEDGIYSFLSSASKIISLSLVLPAILKWLKGQGVLGYEVWMVRFGLLMYVVALYLYGAVEHGWGFLLVTSFIDSFGSSLAGPTMRSLVSTSTAANQQGRVLSVVAFVEAAAALVSPLIFGPLYASLVRVGQEHWAFWTCACGCAVAWIVSWLMRADGGHVVLENKDEEVATDGETDGEGRASEESSAR